MDAIELVENQELGIIQMMTFSLKDYFIILLHDGKFFVGPKSLLQ